MTGTIAVLLTCHNRRDKTLLCLEQLFQQKIPPAISLRVYLVDDGSTDQTSDAVRRSYPAVEIIKGDGSLFWCKGMRLAWQQAARNDADFYLWLNDDTFLRPGCLLTLLTAWQETATQTGGASIIVGSCCDPVTGEHSYGGESGYDKHPVHLRQVLPISSDAKPCDTFNGNCVLVSRSAFQRLGMMRPFQHAMSDTDYGLRARRNGIQVLVAPGYVAECSRNPKTASWDCRELPFRERWRKLIGRKGLPPRDWWNLLWTHAGMRALLYWPVPYMRVLIGR